MSDQTDISVHPILANLNDPQRAAASHIHGPSLILAGAGSGKTKALTHRIAYMMDQGIPSWQILAVTFTNKAATEMKERIKTLLHIQDPNSPSPLEGMGGQGRIPVMGTFHSICARVLRKDIERLGRDRNFVIYDGDDQEKVMKQVLKDMRIDEKELKARAALGYVSRFKSEAVTPKDAQVQATSERMHRVVQAYGRYQQALFAANALDFDDLLLEAVRLFQEVPEVLDRYQETWRYLHVDEYQDTNHVQYLWISLLAQKYRNICVIGDPDQSIYAFRGADIRNIMEFEKEYPDALQVKLEENYRSTQPILTAANAVIEKNPNRPDKNMWTKRTEGPHVVVHEVRDERKEAEEAIKQALEMKAQGTPLNEQVVLYRTNAQSRLIEEACMRNGIPYRIVGGQKFYARKEVKDVLAYLYVIVNPFDTLSLIRIINIPARKIGDTTIGHMQAYANKHQLSLWNTLREVAQIDELNGPTKERIAMFVELIEKYIDLSHRIPISKLAQELLDDVRMEQWLKEDEETGEDRWQNVRELLTVMHKYDALDARTSLTSFLEEAALVSEVDKLSDVRDDALTLMTLHLCKGLEFDHVMIVGCEEGIFPHSNSAFDKEQLEEERRIMYVGMTRAKQQLRVFFARSRILYGETQSNAPSRFIDDLPEAVTERRSDELLSAFAWATESGSRQAQSMGYGRRSNGPIEPFRQHSAADDVNQDVAYDDGEPQTSDDFQEGTRIAHPSFGEGTILSRRGDVVTIQFGGGIKKTFALSIAPLRKI